MLLVAGPSAEFLRFIQVLSWIILPVMLSAIVITLYLHYRRRRRNIEEVKAENYPAMGFPAQVGYTTGRGEYILFDHSALMRHVKIELSYSHARYAALQHDFNLMDDKYATLAKYAQIHFITDKAIPMENSYEPLPARLQADIDRLAEDEAVERKALLDKLTQLE